MNPTLNGRVLLPPTSLAGLLKMLADVDDVRWIRLLYCYPNFVTDELLDTIASLDTVVKYIDMPLQHADDEMLRAMRRESSRAPLGKILERIRPGVPGAATRTRFIVRFPGTSHPAFPRRPP